MIADNPPLDLARSRTDTQLQAERTRTEAVSPARAPRARADSGGSIGQGGVSDRQLRRMILRKFLIGFVPVIVLTAAAWPHIPRRYVASAVVVLRPSDSGASGEAKSLRQVLDENAVQSELDYITSSRLADVVIKQHELLSDSEFAPEPGLMRNLGIAVGLLEAKPVSEAQVRSRLSDHLSVSRERKSYTVSMGYWSADPAKAAAMTQTLLNAYLDDQVDRKHAEITKVAVWMRADADTKGANYQAARQSVEKLLTETGLMDTGEQVAIDSQLVTLSNETAQIRARIIEASVRLGSLRAMKTAGNIESAPDVLTSPTVRRLKENLAAALSKSAVLGSETRSINTEIAAEADRIVQAVEVELGDLQRREAMLQAEIGKLRAKLVERRRNELRLDELKAQAALSKDTYDKSIQRMQSQLGRVDGLLPDAEVVAAAEAPQRATFPKLIPTGIASIMLAVMIGILTAWRPLLELARRLRGPAGAPWGGTRPEHENVSGSQAAIPAAAVTQDALHTRVLRL